MVNVERYMSDVELSQVSSTRPNRAEAPSQGNYGRKPVALNQRSPAEGN